MPHWGEYLPAWHPWEDYRSGYAAREDFGGGVLLTLCHPFDYLRWLIGEIEGVSAMTGHRGGLDIGVEDTANVMLRFANGALGIVHLDYIQRPATHTLRITGQQGCILWDNADGGVQWYQSETEVWETERMPMGFERNELFVEEMKHFISCIEGDTEPCVKSQRWDRGTRDCAGCKSVSRSREGDRDRTEKERFRRNRL